MELVVVLFAMIMGVLHWQAGARGGYDEAWRSRTDAPDVEYVLRYVLWSA